MTAFVRSMKDVCMTKCINVLIKFFLNINVVFANITQHLLLVMAEEWKEILEKGWLCGAMLMDLSKAFDCINYVLLIAKLTTY